jgi:hypothetical protein
MKELKEADLQIGDILIFENQDFDFTTFFNYYSKSKESAAMYLLLYLIPWFDPGEDPKIYKNIYHAAIWGNVNIHRGENKPVENLNRIVQAGTHGIGQADLNDTLKGTGVKNIYVYRFENKDVDFETNINTQIRAFYNDTSIPYSYETAWLLAVICSMRYTDGELYNILNNKFGKGIATFMVEFIQGLINTYNDDHQKEMVACSTLVAMIYKNANYPLKIKEIEKNTPLNIPIESNHIKLESEITEPKNKNLINVSINETIVTPRQLFESLSVKEVGYFPFKG